MSKGDILIITKLFQFFFQNEKSVEISSFTQAFSVLTNWNFPTKKGSPKKSCATLMMSSSVHCMLGCVLEPELFGPRAINTFHGLGN